MSLKKIINLASFVFPNIMTKIAYQKLSNPQVMKLREYEIECLNTAIKKTININNHQIQTYTWKGGEESVLLVHGWEGQAGNFTDLIYRLQEENFTIYAFDAPSHGFSSKQDTSIFDFTDSVIYIIKKLGIKNIVSHSFGGVAVTFALHQSKEIEIDKYYLITTPDKFSERINDVANSVGINENVKNKLIHKIENELNQDVSKLNVSDFVKDINVKKAKIIHDKNDRVIPILQSRNIDKNWENCTLEEIEGTGHFRILRTDYVLNDIINFLKQP